jgi:hypothetical protein
MDTLNYILLKGKDQLGQKPDILRVILSMAHTAMFSEHSKQMSTRISNNVEGAILI